MLTAPRGKPASIINSPKRRAVRGVCSAGFRTTEQPVARAGPSFHEAINNGKFQLFNKSQVREPNKEYERKTKTTTKKKKEKEKENKKQKQKQKQKRKRKRKPKGKN